jgi:hypothetical protein
MRRSLSVDILTEHEVIFGKHQENFIVPSTETIDQDGSFNFSKQIRLVRSDRREEFSGEHCRRSIELGFIGI